jgi:hypothetical protein
VILRHNETMISLDMSYDCMLGCKLHSVQDSQIGKVWMSHLAQVYRSTSSVLVRFLLFLLVGTRVYNFTDGRSEAP